MTINESIQWSRNGKCHKTIRIYPLSCNNYEVLGHKKDVTCICIESRVIRVEWISELKKNWTLEKGSVTRLGTKGGSGGWCRGADHVAQRWETKRRLKENTFEGPGDEQNVSVYNFKA